jgi:hypothetical protein
LASRVTAFAQVIVGLRGKVWVVASYPKRASISRDYAEGGQSRG